MLKLLNRYSVMNYWYNIVCFGFNGVFFYDNFFFVLLVCLRGVFM